MTAPPIEKRTVFVMSPGDFTLSEDAQAFMRAPARPELSMPMVDDIYSIDTGQWFPVLTMPCVEKKVAFRLQATGVRSYLPISADWRRQSARDKHMQAPKIRIERALFPGYLFAKIPPVSQAFGRVYNTDGVRGILGDFGRPLSIRSEIIEAIQKRQEEGAFDATIKGKGRTYVPKGFENGKAVKIKGGQLKDFEAMIRAVLPNDRIAVEAVLFGRSTKVELDIAEVELV